MLNVLLCTIVATATPSAGTVVYVVGTAPADVDSSRLDVAVKTYVTERPVQLSAAPEVSGSPEQICEVLRADAQDRAVALFAWIQWKSSAQDMAGYVHRVDLPCEDLPTFSISIEDVGSHWYRVAALKLSSLIRSAKLIPTAPPPDQPRVQPGPQAEPETEDQSVSTRRAESESNDTLTWSTELGGAVSRHHDLPTHFALTADALMQWRAWEVGASLSHLLAVSPHSTQVSSRTTAWQILLRTRRHLWTLGRLTTALDLGAGLKRHETVASFDTGARKYRGVAWTPLVQARAVGLVNLAGSFALVLGISADVLARPPSISLGNEAAYEPAWVAAGLDLRLRWSWPAKKNLAISPDDDAYSVDE